MKKMTKRRKSSTAKLKMKLSDVERMLASEHERRHRAEDQLRDIVDALMDAGLRDAIEILVSEAVDDAVELAMNNLQEDARRAIG